MRRIRGEQTRVTCRLPVTERREAERYARASGVKLSVFIRQAIREKIERERGGPSELSGPQGPPGPTGSS